ncbi:hypothetical protein [Nitratireductor sp. ZSWI3]|uniref:hypothetical protein n=1 Tax=Nitratireductor sp. ZSWI3 TaxID=2966359 RepID=UPI00214FCFB6|nr:hypothetical protein [Nitratireductor sp. ZSWI3]MCR4265764.1 hypothetical protein [Nitratireductor sp. ZSWI3]
MADIGKTGLAESGTISARRGRSSLGLVTALALAGCNTGSVLDVNSAPTPDAGLAGATAEQPLTPPAAALAPGQDAIAAPAQAAITTGERVQFAPVIGATAEAVPALSRRLEARARQAGIPIVQQTASASILMKGYFSAIADGGKTTIIYVWDVLDPSGNRLHRIQGQQAAPGGNGDGWSSVTPATMEAVADTTISQLAAWLAQRKS